MKRLLPTLIALFTAPAMAADLSNNEVGVSASLASAEITGFESARGFGLGVFGSTDINDSFYVGGSFLNQFVVYELENSDNYIDGNILGIGGLLGVDIEATDTVNVFSELQFVTSSSNLEYHTNTSTQELDTDSLSGLYVAAGLILTLDQATSLALGFDKGITGDYEDDDPSLGLAIKFSSPDDIFGLINYTASQDSFSVGARLGFKY